MRVQLNATGKSDDKLQVKIGPAKTLKSPNTAGTAKRLQATRHSMPSAWPPDIAIKPTIHPHRILISDRSYRFWVLTNCALLSHDSRPLRVQP